MLPDIERLQSYLETINDSLGKTQISARIASSTDLYFMKDLIKMTNFKIKGINAYFANTPDELQTIVKNLIAQQDLRAKIIVNLEASRIHFMAFDFCRLEDDISLIGIESATLQSLGASMLAFQCQMLLLKLSNINLIIIETDLQRSSGECGIFSLAMIKTMFKEKEQMYIIHQRNIKKNLPVNMGVIIPVAKANHILPPSFMKHSQSMNRLKRYLQAYQGAESTPINKQGETLLSRQQRYFGKIYVGEKKIKQSYSIEAKRQKEIMNLIQFINESA